MNSFRSFALVFSILLLFSATGTRQTVAQAEEVAQEQEIVYSGPQIGEELVRFEVQDLLSDEPKTLDPIAAADGKPLMLIFVHEITRPAIGLVRSLVNGASQLSTDGPRVSLIFLSDDPTETRQWAKRARRALPEKTAMGISTEGAEGPGAYGLNRKVSMTVLIGKENEVTGNFALIQPSIQADAPKIIEVLAKTMKVDVPADLQKQLNAPMRRGPAQPSRDSVDENQLRSLLRPVINKQATADEVAEAAKKVEAAFEKSEALRKRIGEICRRIIMADKLNNYGNEHSQAVLKRWADELK